ncbi:MAG TPA: AzlD domain-containing protein [Acidimicrobiia bacterium]|nr:AzlD domain-containing protein [Acidimicrobiia bacterium]
MSSTLLILAVALITFTSRAVFMLRPVAAERVKESGFLNAFPVALFVAIATIGLAAPEGTIAVGPSLAAGLGGLVWLVRKSILAVVIAGVAAYWLVRLIT